MFNPLYWDTACLIVNSGSLESVKDKNANYAKTANALNEIKKKNIKVSLIDINRSNYTFDVDEENNQILFGLKALSGVNAEVINKIIKGRPYNDIKDFMRRCPLDKKAMISLIKSGAFDTSSYSRYFNMCYYLSKTSDLKTKITLQNINGLIQRDLIPNSLYLAKKIIILNKYLRTYCKGEKYYKLDEKAYSLYKEIFEEETLSFIEGIPSLPLTNWEMFLEKEKNELRDWIRDNQSQILAEYNMLLLKENWEKYAQGNLSSWEMDSLCFYYHEHELSKIDNEKYGLVDFEKLPTSPEVDYYFKRGGMQIPIYKTFKIIGTVLSKNDVRSTISLLTTTGVVNVKFTKEYFAMYARQLSEKQEDGTKKVIEKGWFQRGVKLMITGFRRDDTFVAKSYSHTPTHQLYKITLDKNGTRMGLEHERYGELE